MVDERVGVVLAWVFGSLLLIGGSILIMVSDPRFITGGAF